MADEQCGHRDQPPPRGPLPRLYPRRTMLRGALSAVALTAGGALLAACGAGTPATSTPAPTTSTPATGGARPTTASTVGGGATATAGAATAAAPAPATAATSPAAAVDGRIPANFSGVPDGYTKRPPVFKTVTAVPGRGGKMTIFDFAVYKPTPPRQENRYWQELERRLGVTIEPTFAPSGTGYTEKFAALAASNDLADITFLIGPSPAQLRLIDQGAFTDLTPFLTGDALKEYPNIALYPERIWKNSAVKGKLYGVPRPLSFVGNPLLFRADWAKKLDNPQPRDADQFFQLMVDFTKKDPDGNGKEDSWGLGNAGSAGNDVYTFSWIQQMFRTPNEWRKNPDGTLTSYLETEEFKAALAYARRLHDAGIYHPDTGTMTPAQAGDAYSANKVGGYSSGIFSHTGPGKSWEVKYRESPGQPILDQYAYFAPPAFDGGQRATHNTPGFFGIAAIPSKVGRDRERVKELLRILNYYAAPFGSEEWAFMNYGLEGTHHDVKPDGSLAQNERGASEIGDFWHLGSGERIYYQPTPPGAAQYIVDYSRAALEVGVDNPTLGLYSATSAAKQNELTQFLRDRIGGFVTGREPLSGADAFVRDWRSRGGDAIRQEFEQDLKRQ